MNLVKTKKIINFSIDVYSNHEKMDNVLDFLIDNNISITDLINQISPILDWYELSDLERMCLCDLYHYIYEKTYNTNEK